MNTHEKGGSDGGPAVGGLRSGVLPHLIGLAWVIGAAILVLLPALHHGLSLGPYDILSQSGLTRASGITVRNSASGDQISEMIPWSTLAWTQVHAGHIPLWNPFNGLGLPLAFNWQSGVFSLPTVIGYAFPLHLAYTAQIFVTLLIAGTGAYALARVLHLGTIGCATAGTIYELSGSFTGWLGWPHAAVMSWAGWLLAATILIVRGGHHRTRNIAAFAVVFALAVFSGQPEILTILLVSAIVVASTMLIMKMRAAQNLTCSLGPLLDLSVAMVAGVALGSPLLLPGLQVLARSTRNSGALLSHTEVGKSLPPHDLIHLLAQGYNGLPIAGSQVFGDAVYFDTAAYLGTVAIALAILGVTRGWRRPEVVSFVALTVVTLAIVFAPPIQALFLHLPLVQTIDWHRALMPLSLGVAILAGVGIDALVRDGAKRSTQLLLAGTFTCALTLLLVVWLVGTSGLPPIEARLRRDSLIWPLASAGLALAIVGVLAVWTSKRRAPPYLLSRTGRFATEALDRESSDTLNVDPRQHGRMPSPGQVTGGLLLLLETAFLVASGAQLWPSSPQGVSPTPGVSSLIRSVGDSTVGFGAFTCFDGPAVTPLGILPEANSLFGIHQFDFYDPILPHAYFQSWAELSRSSPGVPIYNSFCPVLTTASQARRFGVQFVLEPRGAAGPTGSVFDRTVGNEDLYRIPDSGEATLTPLTPSGSLPAVDASGTPVTVEHRSPSSWRITTVSQRSQDLRLRLTDEPGWHATIDGHPVSLEPFADVMMQVRVPPGHHVIEVSYWPTLFTVGLILSASCAIVLLAALVIARSRRHNRTSAC